MNELEKQAYKQVVNATEFIVGGYENWESDDPDFEMPPFNSLVEEIYETVLTCTTYPGTQLDRPIKEIRFVGKDWLVEKIKESLNANGYKE